MRAARCLEYGPPESVVVEELPDPVPERGQVVVTVEAAALNYPDVLIIEDRYQFKPPRPFAPGGEVAGVIESVGSGVTQFKPGDRVIGSTISGGMAEKLVVEASLCIAMPAAMPFDEASALVLTYGTSIYALKDRAKLRK
jgi:NADPH2:quinone reductase